jgi:hypothetical protein
VSVRRLAFMFADRAALEGIGYGLAAFGLAKTGSSGIAQG